MRHKDSESSAQELRVAVGRVAHRLRQLWDSGAARDGISFTEGAILTHLLREGPSSPTGLAGNERVTSQAVAAHLGNLEGRDLVRRSPDPSDGRKVVVTITPAGRAALSTREGIIVDSLTRALQDLSGSERQQLFAATPLLSRLADRL